MTSSKISPTLVSKFFQSFPLIALAAFTPFSAVAEDWIIDSQNDWTSHLGTQTQLKIAGGTLMPTGESATYQSAIKTFTEKHSARSITIVQSPVWLNWQPVDNIGPANLLDAPVFLQMGAGDY